jgi:hypothetical protein
VPDNSGRFPLHWVATKADAKDCVGLFVSQKGVKVLSNVHRRSPIF